MIVELARMLDELLFLILKHLFSFLSPLVFLLLSLSSHLLAFLFKILLEGVSDVDLVALPELFKQNEAARCIERFFALLSRFLGQRLKLPS